MNSSQANPHKDATLTTLIEAVLNGQADDAQFAELERRLQSDAAARDAYVTYMNLHCELTTRFAVEGDIVGLEAELEKEFREGELADFRRTLSADSMRRELRRPLLGRVLAVTVVAALVLVGVIVWSDRHSQNIASSDTPAQVRDVEGQVTIIRSTETVAAQVGDVLRPGDRLRTDEQNGRAVLEYADGTTVEVHFDSAVQAPADGKVRLRLLSGSIEVDAAPQPADHPLIFATDHARYVVLGTRFRLYRNEDSTRLELAEGNVRLERQEGDRIVETVEVEAGNAATASAEAKPVELVPLAQGQAELRKTLAVTGQDVVLSPAGDLLVVNDGGRGLTVCRSDDFTIVSEYKRDTGPSYGLAFAPDGQSVVRLSHDHVLVWKPGESEARKLPLARRPVRSRALSPDGRFVAESSDEGIELSSVDLAAGELEPIAVLPNRNGKSGKAWSLAFSQDGSRLAAGFWDGTLRTHELSVGGPANPSYKIAHEYKLTTTLTHVAISADGADLATFNSKDGVVLIDTSTGEQHSLWSSAGANVVSLRFTPDGRWLMAGCSDGTARLWSVADIRPLLVIDTDHLSRGLAWMPERRWLVTADGNVKVWAVETPIPKLQPNTSQ